MINKGGEKVYPGEVETFLAKHPAVKEVAVIGVPDQDLGEQVCAWIVANDGLSGVCSRVEDCLPGVGASLKAGKVSGSVLSGVVFAIASHDQVMDLRGDAHGDILRTAAAATGAGKIKHEDVGC